MVRGWQGYSFNTVRPLAPTRCETNQNKNQKERGIKNE